jgi:hypothetical protein
MVEAAMEASEAHRGRAEGRLSGWLGGSWGPVAFVFGVWAVMVGELLRFASLYVADAPFADEFEMVPVITGHAPISLSWLWSQHNEHRIPLSRLVYLGVDKIAHHDFRVGAFVNCVMLSAIAAACVVTAWRLRGRVAYTDAFFPLLLLHWGQWENLVLSFQMAFVLPVAISVLMLLSIALSDGVRVSRRVCILYGACLVTLPLCGGVGLGLVPALSLWASYVGVVEWRSGDRERKKTAVLLGALTAVSLILIPLYFVGYQRPVNEVPPPPGAWWLPIESAMRFLTVGFGPVVRNYWPLTGALTALLLGATAAAAAWMIRMGNSRTRAVGFLAFMGAIFCLAIGIARARTGLGTDVLYSSRYTTVCAPLFLCVYFVWQISGFKNGAQFAQASLFAASLLLLLRNADEGDKQGGKVKASRQQLIDRAGRGASASALARHFTRQLYPSRPILEERLRMLHDANIGAFKSMKAD